MKINNTLLVCLFSMVFIAQGQGFLPCENKLTSRGTTLVNQETFSIDYAMGKFDPARHNDFVKVPIGYADQADRYLRKDVFEAFKKMATAAKKAGHRLVIKSATRNFDNQKSIWEKKWDGVTILEDNTKASSIEDPVERARKILLYSSMPGTSRHHWGTDIDLNSFENKYFEKGKGKKIYDWLTKHGAAYGFCRVYNAKALRPNGYNEEKWHWSYLPIASQIMAIAKSQLNNTMIKGFKGAETAIGIDMVKNYVLSINSECN